MLDRFAQLGPKVFFCCTRYRHGGRVFSRLTTMKGVVDGLASLQHAVRGNSLEKYRAYARVSNVQSERLPFWLRQYPT